MDAAMETLSGEFQFHVHWKAFLLNPRMPEEGEPLEQYFTRKYGRETALRFLGTDTALKKAGRAVVSAFLVPEKISRSFYSYFLLAVGDILQP